MNPEDESKWVDEHMEELARYEGQYIAVVDGKVLAHGTEWQPIDLEAERQGHSYPFITRIENGKHIDLYRMDGGITVLPTSDDRRPTD